jgi:predicted amidophosphoribosyltransferase
MMNCALLFFGERCELCDQRQGSTPQGQPKKSCDDCGKPFTDEDAGGNGYESQSWDHAHLVALGGGGMGYQPMKRVICRVDYRLDFVKTNGTECPV